MFTIYNLLKLLNIKTQHRVAFVLTHVVARYHAV